MDPAAPLPPALPAGLSKLGGQATLVRAPAAARAAVAAASAEAPALVALARRVKASFDPRGIFNPGRLYAGV